MSKSTIFLMGQPISNISIDIELNSKQNISFQPEIKNNSDEQFFKNVIVLF